MAQTVRLPDGRTASFPDEATPDQIQSALLETFPQFKPTEPDPGYLGDTWRGLKHDVEVTLPESTGKALKFFGAEDTGQGLIDYAKTNDTPDLQESATGRAHDKWYSPRGNVYEAGDNAVLSMAPGAAGAAIGAGVGSVVPGIGTALGALAGYGIGSIASLPIFYGSQAQESYETVKKHQLELGVPEIDADRIARNTAHVEGSIEAGGELVQDFIPFAKLFKPFGKPVAKAVVSGVLKPTLAGAAKTVGEVVGGEVATEMAQQAGEDWARKAIGDTGEGATWDETAKVIMPTALMSVVPGGAGAGAHHYKRTVALNALTSPETDPDLRARIAVGATAAMSEENKDVAQAFAKYAAEQIDAKKPIEITDDDQFYLQYKLQTATTGSEAIAAAEAALAAPVDALTPAIDAFQSNFDANRVPSDSAVQPIGVDMQGPPAPAPTIAMPTDTAPATGPLAAPLSLTSEQIVATAERLAGMPVGAQTQELLALDRPTRQAVVRAMQPAGIVTPDTVAPPGMGEAGRIINEATTAASSVQPTPAVSTGVPAYTQRAAQEIVSKDSTQEMRPHRDVPNRFEVVPKMSTEQLTDARAMPPTLAVSPTQQQLAEQEVPAAPATRPVVPAKPLTAAQIELNRMAADAERSSLPRRSIFRNSQLRDVDAQDISGEKVTHNMRRFLTQIGKLTGTKVVFEFAPEDSEGAVPVRGENVIHINTAAQINPLQVMGHEVTHVLKDRHREAWTAIRDALVATMPDKRKALDAFAEDYWYKHPDRLAAARAIADWSQKLTPEQMTQFNSGENTIEAFLLDEMTSDLGGSHWSSEQFWTDVFAKIEAKHGGEKAKGIIQRLVASIKETLNKFLMVVRAQKQGDYTTVTPEQLEKTRDAVTSAYAKFINGERTATPQEYAVTDRRISTSDVTSRSQGTEQQATATPDTGDIDDLESARENELSQLSPQRKDQRLFFEVAPNPKDTAAVAAWQQRTDKEKQAVSNDVVERVVPGLLRDIGVTGKVVTQLGGWKAHTNPSFALVVTKGDAALAARSIGYVLDQEAVYAMGLKPFAGGTKTGIIRIDLAGKNAHNIYMQVREIARAVITGHSTIGNEMLIGLPVAQMNRFESAIDAIARKNDVGIRLDEGYGAVIGEKDYGIQLRKGNTSGQHSTEGRIADWRTKAREAFSGTDRPDVSGNERNGSIAPEAYSRTERSVSAVGIHYSQRQREYLSSSAYGTGLKGAEAERVAQSDDPRIKHRIYFYVNAGRGIRPEQGVGAHAHRTSLTNLYDENADPLNLTLGRDANEFESSVLDAGFNGYVTHDTGMAVLLGPRTQQVTYVGRDNSPAAPVAERATPSTYRSQRTSLEARKDLPSGKMSGADWKRMVKDIDVSHLSDNDEYYKSQLVKRPETARMSEPRQLAALQEIERGKLTMDGEYGYNTYRSLWKEAEGLRGEYPDDTQYDIYKDLGGTGVVYGNGGYNRYSVKSDGSLAPIPASFSNKDALAKAQVALTAPVARMSEARPPSWYYSPLARAADAATMKTAPASGWKDWLKSLPAKGVKPDEIKWSGIEEWLDVQGKKPVTREQVQSFLSDFGIKVETILRGERNPRSDNAMSEDIDEEDAERPEINFGEWETDEPDESYLQERASEQLEEEINERIEQDSADIADELRAHVMTNVTPESYKDDIRSDAGTLFQLSDEELTAEANRRAAMDYVNEHWQAFADDPDLTLDDDEDAIATAMERAFAVASGDMQALEEEAERRARAEIDEDKLLDELIDRERQYYYDNYDSPQTRRISVDGVDGDFYHSSSYGEQLLYYNGDEVRILRNADDADIEGAIYEYLSEEGLLEKQRTSTGFVPTKWDGYTTDKGRAVPGSYREVQLTLPPGTHGEVKSELLDKPRITYTVYDAEGVAVASMAQEENAKERAEKIGGTYETITDTTKSKHVDAKDFIYTVHWGEKNVIGHVRFDEHIDEDGKRVMVLQEVQGDWGQQRREGLESQEKLKEQAAAIEAKKKELREQGADVDGNQELSDMRAEYDRMDREASHHDIPDPAPFIEKTVQWAGLVMKRMIAHAIEYGFDKVVWTSGAQQVERWRSSLRKEVDTIAWEKTPEGIHIRASKNGKVRSDTRLAETVLSDHIGKTMARQIISDPNQSGEITGNDITISDTGMAGFYDRMLPNITNEILKKLDKSVHVGEQVVHAVPHDFRVVEDGDEFRMAFTDENESTGQYIARSSREEAEADIDNAERENAKVIGTQLGFEITDKLRESAAAGLPLMSERRRASADRAADNRRAWYYSQLSVAVNDIPRKIKTGKEAAVWLQANAGKLGVKKDELVWSGVLDWLAAQPTPAGVNDWLRDNGVRVREVVLGEESPEYRRLDAELQAMGPELTRLGKAASVRTASVGDVRAYSDAVSRSNELFEQRKAAMGEPVKFDRSELNLPGGSRYRELLLTLPSTTRAERDAAQLKLRAAHDRWLEDNSEEASDAAEAAEREFDRVHARHKAATFRSSHFPQPNIIAHLRFNERTDADGKRVLFIEEVQSDWAQKGRREGFAQPQFTVIVDGNQRGQFNSRAEAEQAIKDKPLLAGGTIREVEPKGPPLAPFVTDTKAWTALALKRAIAYAVDNGFDRVAYTTGEQQADRYDLRKQVDKLVVYDDNTVSGFKDGMNIVTAPFKDESDLAGIVGKEAARKLLAAKPDMNNQRVLSGLDLKVGGEGMKGFYDAIVPQVARSLGATMCEVKLQTGGAAQVLLGETTPQPGFDITDKMRDQARIGMPLFSEPRKSTHVDFARMRELGLTEDWREAGYITPRGSLIDLSGKREGGQRGQRAYDHREAGGTIGMQEYMALGNIRIDYNSGSMDISKAPSAEQYRRITEFVTGHNGEITLDLADGLGELRDHYYNKPDRNFSFQYPENVKPARVIADIKRFFSGQQPVAIPRGRYSEQRALNQWAGKTVVRNSDGTLRVMYHGTARDISTFRPQQADAIFLTDDPKFAANFADLSHDWMLSNYWTWMSPEQIAEAKAAARAMILNDYLPGTTNYINEIRSLDRSGSYNKYMRRAVEQYMPSESNIMPLYVRAENPFDYRNPAHVAAIEAEIGPSWLGQEAINGEMHEVSQHIGDLERGDWNAIESPQVQAYIRAHHDSFYVRERGTTNLAVFSPNQVKSASGNSGAYSRTDNDIRRSEGRVRVSNDEMKRINMAQRFGEGLSVVPEDMFHRETNPGIEYSGIYQTAAEHIGDLIHRLSYREEQGGGVQYGIEAAINKAKRFVKASALDDALPQLYRNYEYHRDERDYKGSKEDFERDFRKAATRYAEAYQDMPYATLPQFLAKRAAVNLGKLNFPAVRANLRQLIEILESDTAENNYWAPFAAGQSRESTPRSRITGQPINQSWTDPAVTDWDDFVRKLQDDKIDTKRVLRAIRDAGVAIKEKFDAYMLETNYHGRAAARVDEFADGELRKLLEDMRMRDLSMADLDDYLWARHAPERNAKNAASNPAITDGSGMSDAQSAAILAGQAVTLNGRTIQLTPAALRAAAAVAPRVDAITKGTLDLLVSSGLETQATVDTWRKTYGSYVPLKRDMESDANYSGAFNLGNGTGAGFDVRGSASKRAMGSKRAVTDILANIAMQRERAITRSEKNRISQAIYGLALSAPNPEFWIPVNTELNKRLSPAALAKVVAELVGIGVNPIDAQNLAREPVQRYIDPNTGLESQRINPALRGRESVLSTRINGEDRYVFFSNKKRAQEMVRGLKNLDAAQVSGVLQVIAPVTRWFASINTQYNPVFGLTNGIRDFSTGMLNLSSTSLSGRRADIARNAFSALRGVYADLRDHRAGRTPTSQWAQLYEQFALDGGKTGYRDVFATSADRAEAIAEELKHAGKGQSWLAVGEKRSHIFGWLSDYNSAVENAMRLSAYKVALDNGMSRDAAASLAKNLTVNFNKKGLAATQTGALYAFFNAAVQGTARIGETTVKDGKLTDAGKKILYGGMMLGVLQAMLGAAAGWDDDEPPQFSREKNFIIPITGSDKYISIPMPLGFHVIPNIGRIAAEFAMSGFKNPGKRLVSLANVMLDSFNPIGSGTLAQTLSPTIGDPIVALSENKDWTGKSIYKEDFDKLHPTPGWTRTKDTASPPSRWMSYVINYVTGGGKYGIGMASPTPDTLDYLVSQATGGSGRELLKIAQYASAKASGEELPIYKTPLGVGRFIGETKGQSSEINRFYANLQRIGEHKSALDEMKHAGDGAAIREYLADNPDARLTQVADKAQREVAYLRRQKREVLEKGGNPERVKLLDERITAVAARYNQVLTAK